MIHPDKTMRKLVLVTALLFMSCFGYAQVIGNKLNVYIGYNIGSFPGQSMVKEDKFLAPSLYPNYKILSGFSLKGLSRYNQFYSVGLALDMQQASNWETEEYIDYSNSTLELYSISPVFQLHNRFPEIGLLNRLKVFLEAGPSLGLSRLSLAQPLFDIRKGTIEVEPPMKSNDFFLGIKGGAGVEFIISKALGMYLVYAYQHKWGSSLLYHDKKFTASGITFGIFARLKKDKRYFY